MGPVARYCMASFLEMKERWTPSWNTMLAVPLHISEIILVIAVLSRQKDLLELHNTGVRVSAIATVPETVFVVSVAWPETVSVH